MEGAVGLALISAIDIEALQNKLVKIVSSILASGGDSIDEKFIVDSAMHVWTACTLFDQSLFSKFTQMTDFGSEIKSTGDFILTGLLYSPVEKIRSTFRDAFVTLAKNTSKDCNAINYLISLCSVNFSKISDYPCRQFFSCFNEIVDTYFTRTEGVSENKK